ncbi:MAG: sugar phosphate isomerase/epimerase [Chloroflexi bacterium]|nr:sugar phosphate isomerase/epimerase [Chloroflexota bacterium]MCL5275172.1 sugar phosphate isomerase/epimerase [Chloroflexota bacterium]
MIHSGLVSITFRKLTPLEIVALVKQAGLEGIEWGGDVHVPHGDRAAARDAAHMTRDAGLQVAAYGSYYRVGEPDQGDFESIIETAADLGAPTIRVWAGKRSSVDADAPHREHVIRESRRIAQLAQAAHMTVSYEYHGGTLTDTSSSAIALLQAVDHPAMCSYWQPPVDMPASLCLSGLNDILPWLTHIHVFCWRPNTERRLLAQCAGEWPQYLSIVDCMERDSYAMIEFVKDDSPDNLALDANELLTWLRRLRDPRP